MQMILRCPNCGKSLLARTSPSPTSEIISTEAKTCTGCNKKLEISIRVYVKVVEPEKAKS
jgi:predicted RNA-binding Zn-ribbon protein involved in translation (DUF1610 family)